MHPDHGDCDDVAERRGRGGRGYRLARAGLVMLFRNAVLSVCGYKAPLETKRHIPHNVEEFPCLYAAAVGMRHNGHRTRN